MKSGEQCPLPSENNCSRLFLYPWYFNTFFFFFANWDNIMAIFFLPFLFWSFPSLMPLPMLFIYDWELAESLLLDKGEPTLWVFSSLTRVLGKKSSFLGQMEVLIAKGEALTCSLSLQVCLLRKVTDAGWLECVSGHTAATGVCPGGRKWANAHLKSLLWLHKGRAAAILLLNVGFML